MFFEAMDKILEEKTLSGKAASRSFLHATTKAGVHKVKGDASCYRIDSWLRIFHEGYGLISL